MAVRRYPKNRLDLKRKIAALRRVRAYLRLEVTRMHKEAGYGMEGDLAETEDALLWVEEELRQLTRQYEEGGVP